MSIVPCQWNILTWVAVFPHFCCDVDAVYPCPAFAALKCCLQVASHVWIVGIININRYTSSCHVMIFNHKILKEGCCFITNNVTLVVLESVQNIAFSIRVVFLGCLKVDLYKLAQPEFLLEQFWNITTVSWIKGSK